MILVVALVVQAVFLVTPPEPLPQEAYAKVNMNGLCIQTQEPVWEWIARQRLFAQVPGAPTEELC